jgi:hypothetical protein
VRPKKEKKILYSIFFFFFFFSDAPSPCVYKYYFGFSYFKHIYYCMYVCLILLFLFLEGCIQSGLFLMKVDSVLYLLAQDIHTRSFGCCSSVMG